MKRIATLVFVVGLVALAGCGSGTTGTSTDKSQAPTPSQAKIDKANAIIPIAQEGERVSQDVIGLTQKIGTTVTSDPDSACLTLMPELTAKMHRLQGLVDELDQRGAKPSDVEDLRNIYSQLEASVGQGQAGCRAMGY